MDLGLLAVLLLGKIGKVINLADSLAVRTFFTGMVLKGIKNRK